MNKVQNRGKLFLISAPSGAGKTTISTIVLERFQGLVTRVITYTSRPPRGGEVNGRDYYFITNHEFQEKLARNFFLETTQYDNNGYGSPWSLVQDLAHGKSFLMVTDRQGAINIAHKIPDTILIWLDLSDEQEIRRRLSKRDNDSALAARRFAIATHERAIEQTSPFFKYHILNDRLQEATDEIVSIIREEIGYTAF